MTSSRRHYIQAKYLTKLQNLRSHVSGSCLLKVLNNESYRVRTYLLGTFEVGD